VLWRIFEHKREEVTGGWRKLHDEEFHSLYSSQSIVLDDQIKKNGQNIACILILKGSDDGVLQSGLLSFWTLPII
jgi:hypothetical protein